MNGATASITSGVLDGISSGILLYTALVELIVSGETFFLSFHMIYKPADESLFFFPFGPSVCHDRLTSSSSTSELPLRV